MSQYVEAITEPIYCENTDEHPGMLAVAMDTDFGAYWCQVCFDYYNSPEWVNSEGPVEFIPVLQPEGYRHQ